MAEKLEGPADKQASPDEQYQEMRKRYESRRALNRHLPDHTEWYDLELRMHPKEGNQYGCPASNSPASFGSIKETKEHCLSNECPEQKGFLLMKKAHDIHRTMKTEKRSVRRIPRLREREALLKKSAQALASMDEEAVEKHARYYKFPEEKIRPDIIKVVTELANQIRSDWIAED